MGNAISEDGSTYKVTQAGRVIGSLSAGEIQQRLRSGALSVKGEYFDPVARDWQPLERLLHF